MFSGMQTLTCCILATVCTALPAWSQKLVGTKTVFRTESHEIVIERFDPAPRGTHDAVMLVHGGGGPDGEWRKSGIIEALVGKGYSVFVPHYFDGPGGKWDFTDKPDQFVAFIRTLNDASRYIAMQPEIDNKGIGLVGVSLGGYLVLGLAEEERSHPPPHRSPEIKAVVEWYGGMPGFAVSRMTTMPPVLILHGENDDVVSVKRARDLEQLLKEKSLSYEIKIYPGQGHGFSGGDLLDANRRMASFLSKYLR